MSGSRRALFRFAILVTFGMLMAPLVFSQAAFKVDVPSQDLADALRAVGRQTSTNIIFEPAIVKGLRAVQVRAELTADEAIKRLLEGTKLQVQRTSKDTIVVQRGKTSASEAPPAPLAPGEHVTSDAKAGGGHSFWDRSRSAPEGPTSAAASGGFEGGDWKGMPEVLVSSGRLLNMDIKRSRDDAQPYVIFDRATIVNSGATNLEDFMRQRLTMETTALSESQGSSFLGARSSINLRGLGTDQTLILVDGHRMAGALAVGGVYQPDINGLPLSAIERIEVLPTSASGIYGGNATGGVVNIVLRRDYVGVESKLTYDNAFDSDAMRRRADVSAGVTLEGGKSSVLLAGSYSDGDPLLVKDRDFLTRNRQRILNNDPDYIYGAGLPPLGATTNIRSLNGTNLVLKDNTALNSPLTYVPHGYAGPTSDGGHVLIANAGHYNPGVANSVDSGLQPLLAAPTVKSLMLTLRREFTPRVTAFVEVGGSNNVSESPSLQMSDSFVLRASNPNNPFTTDIRVRTPLVGAYRNSVVESDERRMVAGVIGKLWDGWLAEVDFSLDRSRYASDSWGSSGGAAVGVAGGTLNVMRDTSTYPVDFAPYVDQETVQLPTHAQMKDLTLRVSGPVFTLPSGPVNLSMLLERREETFGPSLKTITGEEPTGNPQDESQHVNSAYIEATVPVVGARNNIPGVRDLELQLAGRWDGYKTSGTNFVLFPGDTVQSAENRFSSTNTTLGLRYQPVADVLLRASYGTGFLPPAINQLVPGSFDFAGFYTDPRRGNAELGNFTSYFGGNANLKPELSRTWAAGLILRPRFLSGLRLSIDWFRIEKRDNIVSPDPADLLANESRFPGRIIREAPAPGDPYGVGPIRVIDGSDINIARASISGYDLQLDYSVPVGRFGTIDWFALGTRTQHYRTQLFPDSPVIEHVGMVTSQSLAVTGASYPLKFKGNLGFVWTCSQWTVGWTTRYLDGYQIDANQVLGGAAGVFAAQGRGGRVASQLYHDAFGTYRTGNLRVARGVLANTEWQLGVRNVFNTRPPLDVSNATGGYYSGFGDPRLASYYLSVKKAF